MLALYGLLNIMSFDSSVSLKEKLLLRNSRELKKILYTFQQADLFLMSTHLPEYIVAAFVKRLSRLCLTGPANALLMVLPFIGNLLLRHKGLSSMITATCHEEDDPYDVAEPDPAKCKAVESGLWEIRSLQSHVLPQVAQSG